MRFWWWMKNWTADGCREVMRESYWKHRNLAEREPEKFIDESPHYIGLYGAYGTRDKLRNWYDDKRIPYTEFEVGVFYELGPFLLMSEEKAIEALAEYVLYQEKPKKAKKDWLILLINKTLQKNAESENERDILFMVADTYNSGTSKWIELVDNKSSKLLETIYKKYEEE